MKFTHAFIERPIFAMVVAILATFIGGIAYFNLPVAQYPEIVPPTVVVRASYPGADAKTVAEELKAVFDPRGGSWVNRRYVPSLLAAIGDVFEGHLAGLSGGEGPRADPQVPASSIGGAPVCRACTQCGHLTMHRQEGCDKCLECGYSKCG